MAGMSVLAVCPSRGRPESASALLESFLATRSDASTRLAFLVDADDPTRKDYPDEYTTTVEGRGSFGGALQQVGPVLGDATAIGVIGDDNRFTTKGWDVILGSWLTDNVGIAYGDDGHWQDKLPTAWWLSRPIVDRLGVAPAFVRHYFMDNYWLELGKAAGCIRYFGDVVIEHLHPLWGKAKEDATYQRNDQNVAHDRFAFRRWTMRGKQAHLATLRSAVAPRQIRTVLADWHHPALWESLRMLFEGRFGWQLYSPIGIEWANRGWQFTHESWKAADYLEFSKAQRVGDHYELLEAEYPEHPRKLLTVDQADALRPDIVLASVAVHRQSFAQMAAYWGARFVYQVGNARQPMDVPRGTLVLASAATGRVRSDVVRYHQEFDRKLFAYSKPQHPERVASFMLRMDKASGPWHWLQDARGVRWNSYGGGQDQRAEGYLAPMSKVADAMRQSGWVWHDKVIGDGYGHVLHNAAAMGRPLIGHASYYKGKLGEPYWQDLKTCIDLDRHEPKEALRLFRAIGQDRDWFEDISRNITAEFDKRVDFDAEAERIYQALA